jgi:hypothetical protein
LASSATFLADGQGIRVVWTWTLRRSRGHRSALAPVGPLFRRAIGGDLERLKSMLESGELQPG